MKVRAIREARADLRQAIRHYEGRRPGLGAEFRAEVLATIGHIRDFPEAWHRLDDDLRQCRTGRFPYGVIYRVTEAEILIVAISHLHREPGHWRDRL